MQNPHQRVAGGGEQALRQMSERLVEGTKDRDQVAGQERQIDSTSGIIGRIGMLPSSRRGA